MIRADGSDDGTDPTDNTVALSIDERGWVQVRRGGLTYEVPRDREDTTLASAEARLDAAAEASRLNSGVVFVPSVAADRESRFLAELTDAMTRPLAIVTHEPWRTSDCTEDCYQQGSGSVYHYEESELSNGDVIGVSYHMAQNQSRQLLTTGLFHSYLRLIVERERALAEDHLADREMIQRRTGR